MNVLNSLLTKISRMLTCTQMRAFLPVRKVPRILPFEKKISADPKLPKDDFPPGPDDLSKNSVADLNVSRTQMDTIRMCTCFNNNWALPHLFSPKYLPAISGIYGHLNSTQLLQVRGFSLWKRVHDSLGGNKAQAKVNLNATFDRDYGNTPSILPDECGLPGKPRTQSSNIPDNAKANMTSQEDRPTILTQPEAVSAEPTRGEDTSIPSEKILDHDTSTEESAAIVSDPRELDATSVKVPLRKKVMSGWHCLRCNVRNPEHFTRHCVQCKTPRHIGDPQKNNNNLTTVEGGQGSATFSDGKARSFKKDQDLSNTQSPPKQMLPLVSQLPSNELSESSVSVTVPQGSTTWLCNCCKRSNSTREKRCCHHECHAPRGQDPNQNWTCACKTINLAGNWRCTTCKKLTPAEGKNWNSLTKVEGDQGSASFSDSKARSFEKDEHLPNTRAPPKQMLPLVSQLPSTELSEGPVSITVSKSWLCACCNRFTNPGHWRCKYANCFAPKGQDPNQNWTCKCGTTNLAGNWRCKTCKKLKPVRGLDAISAVSRTWLCKCCLQYNMLNQSRCGRADCHAPRGQDPNQNWTCECGTANLAGNWRCKACNKLKPIPEPPRWTCEKCNTRNPENFTKYCSNCRTPKNIDGWSEPQINSNALACTFCSKPLEPSSSECNTCKAPTFWQCKICGSDNKENYKNPHQSCPNCDSPKPQSTHFWCESCKKFNASYSPQCAHKDCNAPNGGTDTKPPSAKEQELTASSNFDMILLRQTEKNKTGGTDIPPLGTKELSASSNLNTIMLHQTEKNTPAVEDVPEKMISSLFNEIMNDPLKDFFGDRKFGPRTQTTGELTSLEKLQIAERQAAISAKEDHLEQKYGPAYQRKTPKIIQKPAVPVVPTLKIPPYPITLKELAHLCGKKVSLVLACTKRLGESDLSETSMLEPDLSEIIGLDYGFNVERLSQREFVRQSKGDKSAQQYPGRPPVICVMGHVDHGKTTLLDFLRKSNVAAQEDGGITQRLAAFTVTDTLGKGGQVTFLDTPGHAAFTKMRNSGAQVTDIVCLVIAADDGVSAQTKEVLKLVESFKLSLVVALSKIDRPGIDIEEAKERIQNQLLEHGIVCESYKGDVPVVPVSGITGQGIPELTEILALQSEVLDLRANPEGKAEALVLDATVDQKRGPIIDVVVTWGSLRPRDVVVVGTQSGAIRTLLGSDGKELQVAGPSTPARIIGLKNIPDAGEELIAVASEAEAQLRIKAVEARKPQMQNQDSTQGFAPEVQKQSKTSNSQYGEEASTGEAPRTVPIVVKADADGVLDALCQAVQGIKDEAIDIHIVYKGVGPVSKGDIDRLTVGGDKATIFCFNVKPDTPATKTLAQKEGIDIRRHTVIYHLIDDIKKYVSQFLPEQIVEEKLGSAEILQVFEMTGAKEGTVVAGCRIMDGKITAVDHYRITRRGTELHSSQGLSSLKINNKTVDEVSKGMECGMLFGGFTDFKAGDEIEFFKTESRKRTLL